MPKELLAQSRMLRSFGIRAHYSEQCILVGSHSSNNINGVVRTSTLAMLTLFVAGLTSVAALLLGSLYLRCKATSVSAGVVIHCQRITSTSVCRSTAFSYKVVVEPTAEISIYIHSPFCHTSLLAVCMRSADSHTSQESKRLTVRKMSGQVN